ncbi:MAG: cupin domain-containing protein [Alphaproteobacteria bacterium]|nr:cupin domain-containing protein [Alphaproteobacteria bacterium]
MTRQTLVREPGEARSLRVLGDRIDVLLSAVESGGGFEMFDIRSARGDGPPLHSHAWAEAYFVLEGEVDLVIGPRRVVGRPGHFLYAPGDTLHTFKTLSERARMLVVTGSPGAAALFGALDAIGGSQPPDAAAVMAIAERHGVSVPAPSR